MTTGLFRSAARPVVIDRAVYGTITLSSVLIVYDGWAQLKLLDVLVIIVGPVLAITIGHGFASSLARQAELDRPLTNAERLEAMRLASWHLLVAVPPVMLVLAMTLAGIALQTGIRVVIWVSAASLGFWGGLAAHRAGLRGRRVVLGALAGLALGGVILVLQVLLQPDKATDDAEPGAAVTLICEDAAKPAVHQGDGRVRALSAAPAGPRARVTSAGALSMGGALSRGCCSNQRA
jgi:hypothetical protein